MTPADLDAVIAVVTETDGEDGEEAASDLAGDGVDGHFVLTLGDDPTPVGVTGFRHVPATERTSSLSWTYLAHAHRGRGHGRALLEHALGELRALGCRKVFVKVSDYVDPEDGAIYASAAALYEKLGFVRELTELDFHDVGENLIIHGLQLAADDGSEEPEIAEERAAIAFVGLREIDDSDGAYTFEWSAGRASLFRRGGGSFDRQDLMLGLEGVRKAGGRKVFLTFPSNLPAIHEPLRAAGFERTGRLHDYYERGLHELHFSHDLAGVP